MNEENKRLLSLEKWYSLIKEPEKRKLEDESFFLEDVLKELQTEFGMYNDIRMSKEDEIDQNSGEVDQDYIPVDKPIDMNIHIFGYNLSELPQNIKLFFGFSFLTLIMGIIYYLLYYVRTKNRPNKKKRY